MKYIAYDDISIRKTNDIEDAEIFCVYKRDRSWAFGMRIRGMFTFTGYRPENSSKDDVKKAFKQIMFCKKYGWSYLGKKQLNPDTFEYDPEFMCMYCHAGTFDTESPCPCRGITLDDLTIKTSNGGIYLPY